MGKPAKRIGDYDIWALFMYGFIDDDVKPVRNLPKPTKKQVALHLGVPLSRVDELSKTMRMDDMTWVEQREKLRGAVQGSISERIREGIAVGAAEQEQAICKLFLTTIVMAQKTLDGKDGFASPADGISAAKALWAMIQHKKGGDTAQAPMNQILIQIKNLVQEGQANEQVIIVDGTPVVEGTRNIDYLETDASP